MTVLVIYILLRSLRKGFSDVWWTETEEKENIDEEEHS